MKSNEIEILDYRGEGYSPVMHFSEWRVAMLRHAERFDEKSEVRLERHLLTDEVFVLLEGNATLFIGDGMEAYPMEPHKIYNVKQGVWHRIVVSEDAKVLIVENHNTSKENSEYCEKGN